LFSAITAAHSQLTVKERDRFRVLALAILHDQVVRFVERIDRQTPAAVAYEKRESVLTNGLEAENLVAQVDHLVSSSRIFSCPSSRLMLIAAIAVENYSADDLAGSTSATLVHWQKMCACGTFILPHTGLLKIDYA